MLVSVADCSCFSIHQVHVMYSVAVLACCTIAGRLPFWRVLYFQTLCTFSCFGYPRTPPAQQAGEKGILKALNVKVEVSVNRKCLAEELCSTLLYVSQLCNTLLCVSQLSSLIVNGV